MALGKQVDEVLVLGALADLYEHRCHRVA
jgi:hypothetical protein